jgi:hypothetical protein
VHLSFSKIPPADSHDEAESGFKSSSCLGRLSPPTFSGRSTGLGSKTYFSSISSTDLAAIARDAGLKELIAEVLPETIAIVFEKSGLRLNTSA